MHIFTDYILLVLSFPFNYFISGYVVTELFISKSKTIYKLPLYFILSVLLTTCGVYLSSSVFGFSNLVIFINYLFWLRCFIYLLRIKKIKYSLFERKHLPVYVLTFVVLVVFMLSLYKSIFYFHNGYFVMSADNWQDTALHFSIMESIKEGNFPPAAPYYSGHSLNYHYFTDFHSAIMTKPLNKFYPWIFIFDNSVFAGIFAISIYSLTFYITKNLRGSLFASILATFSGSLLSIKFIRDLLQGGNLNEMLSSGAYVLEYGKLYQMTPVTNYFLQNRPMMVGMPVFAVSLYLLISGIEEKSTKKLVLLFLVSILSFKFQMIVSVICLLLWLIFFIYFYKNKKIIFTLPLFLIPILYTDSFKLFISKFSIGPWVQDKDLVWFLEFVFANIGVLIVLFAIYLILLMLRKVKLTWQLTVISLVFIMLFVVPFLFTFTIDRADMLKFIYISYVPLSILASIVLLRIYLKPVGKFFVPILILISISTGVIDLVGSYVNKNYAYSVNDLEVGEWVRKYTPKGSIFVTIPSVHSPVSDIAGRLRVLSYTNWPYTHGYGDESDNVFIRDGDIKKFYQDLNNLIVFNNFVSKYKVNYVYLGQNEISNFPEAENGLESNSLIEKVYDQNNIKVFKVR